MDSKEKESIDLRKKLKEKLFEKHVLRMTKKSKIDLLDKKLEKAGIDPEEFKKQQKSN